MNRLERQIEGHCGHVAPLVEELGAQISAGYGRWWRRVGGSGAKIWLLGTLRILGELGCVLSD